MAGSRSTSSSTARSGLAATTTTGADGDFAVTVDGYEHFELVVGGTGGR